MGFAVHAHPQTSVLLQGDPCHSSGALCGVRIVVHFSPRVLAFVVTLLYRGQSVASLQYVVSLFYAFIRENHYWWLPCCVYRLHLAIIYIGCYARLCVVSVGIASEKGEAYLQCSPVWFSRCLCYSVFVANSLADCAHARMHTQTTVAKCDLCLT